jgi:hypothetical protein
MEYDTALEHSSKVGDWIKQRMQRFAAIANFVCEWRGEGPIVDRHNLMKNAHVT